MEVFETTQQTTYRWLKHVMEELGTEDRHRAYLALRATLHALRDRLSPQSAAALSAQLPMLVRGFYYEGWNPEGKPELHRTRAEFLEPVRKAFANDDSVDPEEIARAVFRVLSQQISPGEISSLVRQFPEDLRALWPQEKRDAAALYVASSRKSGPAGKPGSKTRAG